MSDALNTQQNSQVNSQKQTKRLGRGLDSLFGDAATKDVSPVVGDAEVKKDVSIQAEGLNTHGPRRLAVEKIIPNKSQPRTQFDKTKLQELSNSIKIHGIIQPLIVRKMQSGYYEIIAGERRWRAAQQAGLPDVPVVIQDLDSQKTLEVALIENIQRSDLNPLEEARAYQKLMSDYKLTQNDVAERVSKDRATVANLLRLLNLDIQVQEKIEKGDLSLGHGKILAGMEERSQQVRLAQLVVSRGLSVRALEKEVLGKRDQAVKDDTAAQESDEVKQARQLSEQLQKQLGTKVLVEYETAGEKGKLTIHFYSKAQLDTLLERLAD